MVDPSTEAPSCRGPPRVRHSRSSHHKVIKPAQLPIKREAPTSGPVQRTDSVVRDDLGQSVPVCAAELEVIEFTWGMCSRTCSRYRSQKKWAPDRCCGLLVRRL